MADPQGFVLLFLPVQFQFGGKKGGHHKAGIVAGLLVFFARIPQADDPFLGHAKFYQKNKRPVRNSGGASMAAQEGRSRSHKETTTAPTNTITSSWRLPSLRVLPRLRVRLCPCRRAWLLQ